MSETRDEQHRRRNLYGRRSGPSLSPRRKQLYEERLARFAVAPTGQLPASLDPVALFEAAEEVFLEIGFGAGEHMVALGAAHPRAGVIACEHYTAGVASGLSKLDKSALRNVRIYKGDARDLLDSVPDAALRRIYLLYPDPWPKTRHHKRRFVVPETLEQMARVLADGGEFRLASDIPDYIDWSRAHLAEAPGFEIAHDSGESWPGWSGTRYEAKALREGRAPHYLIYRRRPR